VKIPHLLRIVLAMLALAVSLTRATPAHAIPPYPGDLVAALKLSYTPACSLCHTNGVTALGTVTTPFGQSMRENGLTFDPSTFAPALAAMKAKNVDSVGRGFSDVQALEEHIDPNAIPANAVPTSPDPATYGCSASPFGTPAGPSRASGIAYALLAIALLGLTRRRRLRSPAFGAAIALSALSGLTGCPGNLSDPAAFRDAATSTDAPRQLVDAKLPDVGPGSCPNVVTSIFTPRCAASPCHTTVNPAGSLDLQSSNIYQRLLGTSGPSGGVLIATNHQPSDSILYEVLGASPPDGYAEMPLMGDKLSASDVACVGLWITDKGQIPDAGKEGGSQKDAHCDGSELTVRNFDGWCSVSIAGEKPLTSATQVACVPVGTVTLAATPTTGFEIDGNLWHGTAGDKGMGDPGTDTGAGAGETSSATVVVTGSTACVSVCCPFTDGSGCPGTNACPP
jgi:hypothetical protein